MAKSWVSIKLKVFEEDKTRTFTKCDLIPMSALRQTGNFLRKSL